MLVQELVGLARGPTSPPRALASPLRPAASIPSSMISVAASGSVGAMRDWRGPVSAMPGQGFVGLARVPTANTASPPRRPASSAEAAVPPTSAPAPAVLGSPEEEPRCSRLCSWMAMASAVSTSR